MTTTELYADHWGRFKAPPRCWFTNLPLMAPESGWTRLQMLQEATIEHLVPANRNRAAGGRPFIVDTENLVWGAAFINNISGNAPICIKMQIRDYARDLIGGNTFLSAKAVERICAFVRHLYSGYRVGTTEIWVNRAYFVVPTILRADDRRGRFVTSMYNELVSAEGVARKRLLSERNPDAVIYSPKNHAAIVVPEDDVDLGPRFKRRRDHTKFMVVIDGRTLAIKPRYRFNGTKWARVAPKPKKKKKQLHYWGFKMRDVARVAR